jgi:uncharacterized protein with HEPN domain
MPSKYDPADCLADIVENAERIESCIEGLDQTDFELNGLVRDAAERCPERICEAAHRLGSEAEELIPGQPWRQIRGMGNQLRHAYNRVTIDIVWDTARYRLPSLESKAREVLVRLRPDGVGDGQQH